MSYRNPSNQEQQERVVLFRNYSFLNIYTYIYLFFGDNRPNNWTDWSSFDQQVFRSFFLFIPAAYTTKQQIYFPKTIRFQNCNLPGLSLRVGHHHVGQSGQVDLPYLESWNAASHNLYQLVASMSTTFGAEPPVKSEPVSCRSGGAKLLNVSVRRKRAKEGGIIDTYIGRVCLTHFV